MRQRPQRPDLRPLRSSAALRSEYVKQDRSVYFMSKGDSPVGMSVPGALGVGSPGARVPDGQEQHVDGGT